MREDFNTWEWSDNTWGLWMWRAEFSVEISPEIQFKDLPTVDQVASCISHHANPDWLQSCPLTQHNHFAKGETWRGRNFKWFQGAGDFYKLHRHLLVVKGRVYFLQYWFD